MIVNESKAQLQLHVKQFKSIWLLRDSPPASWVSAPSHEPLILLANNVESSEMKTPDHWNYTRCSTVAAYTHKLPQTLSMIMCRCWTQPYLNALSLQASPCLSLFQPPPIHYDDNSDFGKNSTCNVTFWETVITEFLDLFPVFLIFAHTSKHNRCDIRHGHDVDHSFFWNSGPSGIVNPIFKAYL